LSAYFRVHDQLRRRSIKYIAEAEELYKDSTKAGGQKFSWVVDNLYELIPPPLKVIITKKCMEKIVQSSFDAIEDYAKMQLDMAVEKYLKHFSDGKDYPDLVDPLTIRETQVLNLLSEGMSNKEIAKKLDITINTVKGYIKNIYGKLEVNRRVQAIEKAKNLKIIKKK
jgi:DNA-binding CsgD family transcriptional regulator